MHSVINSKALSSRPPTHFFTRFSFLITSVWNLFGNFFAHLHFFKFFLCSVHNKFTHIGIDGIPIDVVLVEGILVFYDNDYRTLFDMKIFVETDADIRLARRGRETKKSSIYNVQ
jgi:hypothetical protein